MTGVLLTMVKKVHACAIAAHVEIGIEAAAFFEAKLCKIMAPVVSEVENAAWFQELVLGKGGESGWVNG